MQILVVPDSFKESLSAKEVAEAITKGIHSVNPGVSVKQLPFSDGGEGALDLLQNLFEKKSFAALKNSLQVMRLHAKPRKGRSFTPLLVQIQEFGARVPG